MSSDYSHDQPPHQQPHFHSSQPQILRPLPRRPFELNLTPATSSSSASSQPSPNPNNAGRTDASYPPLSAQLDARLNTRSSTPAGLDAADDSDVKRSRSILNLTASTLFGIYQPTAGGGAGGDNGSEPPTPWGTGAETPAYIGGGGSSSELREWEQLRLAGLGSRNAANPAPPSYQTRSVSGAGRGAVVVSSSGAGAAASTDSRRGSFVEGAAEKSGNKVLGLVARVVALFGFGVVYGVIISHLHDNRHIAPVRVEGIDRGHWGYLVFWGLAGVALGSALPWVDLFWEGRKAAAIAGAKGKDGKRRLKGQVPSVVGTRSRDGASQEWNDVVRSVGAFVGIAFAIVSALFLPLLIFIEAFGHFPASRILIPMMLQSPRLRGLTLQIAQTSVAIDDSDLAHPGPCKSGSVVPARPQQTRLHAIYACRHHRHSYHVAPRPAFQLSRLHS